MRKNRGFLSIWMLITLMSFFIGCNESKMHVVSGNEYYNEGKYNEAIKEYKKAIEIDPGNAKAYNNMGNVLSDLKKHNEAITAFKKAIEIDPQDAYAYYNMGHAYYGLKEYNEAIAAFRKAIEINPQDAYAYYNMGNTYYKLKKYNEAIAAYKKAIEIDPKLAYAYNNMGNAYYGLKKYNEAIAVYKKGIEITPGHMSNKANLAEVYLVVEQFSNAFVVANVLLKEKNISHEDSLAMRFISISSLVFQGKSSEAVDHLKDFIKFYRSIPGDYERDWNYISIKDFITGNKKLAPEQRKLLLQLVDFLESPKETGDRKLKQLENAVKTASKLNDE